jgi:hypothetical protein
MEKVKNLSEKKNLTSRIRFMLLDLLILYNNGWQDKKEIEKSKKNNDGTSSKSNKSGISKTVVQDVRAINKSATSTPSSMPVVDEWSTVSTRKAKTITPVVSSSNLSKSTSTENLPKSGVGGAFALLGNTKRATGKDSPASAPEYKPKNSSSSSVNGKSDKTYPQGSSSKSKSPAPASFDSRVQSPALEVDLEPETDGEINGREELAESPEEDLSEPMSKNLLKKVQHSLN